MRRNATRRKAAANESGVSGKHSTELMIRTKRFDTIMRFRILPIFRTRRLSGTCTRSTSWRVGYKFVQVWEQGQGVEGHPVKQVTEQMHEYPESQMYENTPQKPT